MSLLQRLLVALTLLVCCQLVEAEVVLPSVFGSAMVLQRGRPVPVWGKADPGEKVIVSFRGQKVETTADEAGRWRVDLPAMSASADGATLTIASGKSANNIDLQDVLVGEVWFCSGQSNMQWTVKSSNNADAEIAAANDAQLRLFQATRVVADTPQFDNKGWWTPTSPQTIPGFSAVAYYFGQQLRRELGVPVGLIHSSWGGTPAEAWTSLPVLAADPVTQPIVARWEKIVAEYPQKLAEFEQQKKEQQNKPGAAVAYHADPGVLDADRPMAQADFDDAAWTEQTLPAKFEDGGEAYDGTAWYRKRISLPASMRGKALVLELGAIDDFDDTFVNGVAVGRTDIGVANAWSTPRRYEVPAQLTAGPDVVVAVRVFDRFGGGGFSGSESQMKLSDKNASETIVLAGPWKMKVTQKLTPAVGDNPQGLRPPQAPDSQHRPANLYNAMVHPFVPYAIAGAIWYQGESNASRAEQYRTLLTMMIENWRQAFELDVLPFGIVQLANFQARKDVPGESDWAELREAQMLVARDVPKAGLAVIIDIGDAKDIHPRNKQDVGARLAAWALHEIYGKSNIVPSGPLFREAKIEPSTGSGGAGDRIRVSFDHAVGLTVRGEKLTGFAIAGEDRKWVWADAVIEPSTGSGGAGDTVIVSSPQMTKPIAVRYGWANNPDCNLYNAAGLPASPFRSDDFPMVTAGKR